MYFLIFTSAARFFLRNCHAGKGKEGAGVHFPPSWPTNQVANFPLTNELRNKNWALLHLWNIASFNQPSQIWLLLSSTAVSVLLLLHGNFVKPTQPVVWTWTLVKKWLVCSFAKIEWVVVVWGVEEGRADVLEWLEGHLTCEHTSFAHLYSLLLSFVQTLRDLLTETRKFAIANLLNSLQRRL